MFTTRIEPPYRACVIAEVLVVESIRGLGMRAPLSSTSVTALMFSCSGSIYEWCFVGDGLGFNIGLLTKEGLEGRDVVSLCR